MRNRYHLLLNESEDPQRSDYDKFVKATSEAAKECLRPVPKSKKKVKSLDPRVKALREQVEEAHSAYLSDRKNETARESYKKKKEVCLFVGSFTSDVKTFKFFYRHTYGGIM